MSPSDKSYSVRVGVGSLPLVAIEDYTIREGGITFLFGESGIGKSLINRTIFGLLPPDEFSYAVNGSSGDEYARLPSTQQLRASGFFVFQEPSTHLHPLLTIGEQLREGSLAGDTDEARILAELWKGAASSQPEDLLRIYPKPFRPSGGEKQRILLAMAFKKIDRWVTQGGNEPPPLFIFDEPTGSLDNRFRDIVLHMLFQRYRQRPFTAVVISHDYSMVSVIRRDHADLAPSITYKELTLGDHGLALRLFEPETYLRWLKSQTLAGLKHGEGEIVARVEPSLRVFGRDLRITSDAEGRHPASLTLKRGTMTYLKAPSGMGKTTLVKVMMGLVRADTFRMHLGARAISERTAERYWRRRLWGRKMTMVFQHADEALNPQSSVVGAFHGLPLRFAATRAALAEFLQTLFAPEVVREIFRKKISALSGGQKQRLNLLRGLALQPALLILDEPLNGLDFDSSVRVLEMLKHRLQNAGAILVISHNEEIFDSQVDPSDIYYLGEAETANAKDR